ncbi:hypothetical protein RI367_001801 [Sorochytrium milnesiophthora]
MPKSFRSLRIGSRKQSDASINNTLQEDISSISHRSSLDNGLDDMSRIEPHHAEESEIFRSMAPMSLVDQEPPMFDLPLELEHEHERQRERAHEQMLSGMAHTDDAPALRNLPGLQRSQPPPQPVNLADPHVANTAAMAAEPFSPLSASRRSSVSAARRMSTTQQLLPEGEVTHIREDVVASGQPILHNEQTIIEPSVALAEGAPGPMNGGGAVPPPIAVSNHRLSNASFATADSVPLSPSFSQAAPSIAGSVAPSVTQSVSGSVISSTMPPSVVHSTIDAAMDLQTMPTKEELQQELKQVNEIQRTVPVPHINALADLPPPTKADFMNPDGSVRWLALGRAKLQRAVHTMAMDKVDDVEDQEFKVGKVKSHIDRIYENTKYMQEVGKTVASISRWDNPAVTSMVMMLYFFLVLEELVLPSVVGVLIGVLSYFGLKRPATAKSLGLSCLLYDATSVEPRFSNQSQRDHRLHLHSLRTPLSTGAANSPLHPKNLVKAGIDDLWPELRNDMLGWVQLELRDMADLIEKAKNMLYWRKPGATFIALMAMIPALPVVYMLPARFLIKPTAVIIGLEFFVLVPLQNRFPRYRRLFSLGHLALWTFPTDAEWAIQQYAQREALVRQRAINEDDMLTAVDPDIITPKNKELLATHAPHLAPDGMVGPSSASTLGRRPSFNSSEASFTPGSPLASKTTVTTTTTSFDGANNLTVPRQRAFSSASRTSLSNPIPPPADLHPADAATILAEEQAVKEFGCTFDHSIGKMYLTSNTLIFRPNALFSREKHEVVVPYTRIVKLKKSNPRHYIVARNKRLEITLTSGETLIFSNMRERDNAFNSLAAYSNDDTLRWRIPGT